ncbi:hypothetical protein EV702DRAFT_1191837 [Suillus placidus]|uniref:Uncharacterized protein n=1 Tax=Suillus placidus TaxID=48579 RepID=A0A9P7A6S1_9AGAM|nr:hypothetical protein EV702DRAFT_1191837 [Suillus placidus]
MVRVGFSSLLPGESFSFVLPPEDSRIWTSLLHSFNTATTALPSLPSPIPQVKFQVKATDARISFEVQLPERHPEDADVDTAQVPLISVNGDGVSRDEHRRWRAFVKERLADVQGNNSDYPIYQLLCIHLLPKLHEDGHSINTGLSDSMEFLEQQSSNRPTDYRALLTSHHLVSPTKRRSLQRWSSELSISGFAKVGYTGIIYAQGSQENSLPT